MNTAVLGSVGAASMLASGAAARTERVEFRSGGERMVGTLFLPDDAPKGTRLPTVVVVGPWLNVKEQVAANYAARLARKGFAALAFDFRHWGKSEGEPREVESPKDKIADIHAALAFVKTRPEVAPDRIGLLGVCFGVGYVGAAADDPTVKSVATVAAWVHDVPSIKAMIKPEEYDRRMRAGAEAKAAYARDKTVIYVPAGSNTDKEAAMFSPDPHFYYTDTLRGVVPTWTNRYAVLSWPEWLEFDGIAQGANITQPLMCVHSDGSALPGNLRRFYALAKGPRELVWMEGEHTQFYDTPPYVDRAADAVAAHFARTLMAPEERERLRAEAESGVREFFAALEAKDIARFLTVWADDGVQTMPYAPPGFPSELKGKAAIERQYAPLPTAYASMRFTLKSLRGTDDPNVVVAEYDGLIALNGGGRYDNRYVGTFAFENGRLARYAEYFDPLTLLDGFPGAAERGPDGPKRIVQAMGHLADARDWTALRGLFADTVDLDYKSVSGLDAAPKKADDLVAGWQKGLGSYAETHHTFAEPKVEVRGDDATATYQGQATHLKQDGGRWSCGGDYRMRLHRGDGGWKVVALRFDMKWEQGDR